MIRWQRWSSKFHAAAAGVADAMRRHDSFWVHLPAAAAVLVAAALLQMAVWQWCVLLLCITGVLVAELMNTALESLAKAIDRHPDADIKRGLDVASGAVLVASLGAAATGAVLFLDHLWRWLA